MARRTGYRLKTRFATVGYKRDVEKKYYDRTTQEASKKLAHATNGFLYAMNSGGPSGGWQDIFKGVPQGVNSSSRIGNVIDVKYVKGKVMLTANRMTNALASGGNAQNGEAAADNGGVNLLQYVRTTYRVAIVRDLQMNSVDSGIVWNDVFEGATGVMAQLNVANMGRFRVLMDRTVELDADDPQKVISFMFRNLGKVRYNGPETEGGSPALTDSGMYLVWAVASGGMLNDDMANKVFTSVVWANARVCFTDA